MKRAPWLLLVLVAACGKGDEGTTITITGVVRHFEIEGGFYAIRGADSVTYDPTNLPAEYQKDGLAVEAVAHRRDDMMSTHQVGPIVEIERIRARRD